MKRTLTQALTTFALIMIFSVAAYAGHNYVACPGDKDAAATQVAPGQTRLRADGHLN
jgi:hypothetical protein